MPQVMCIKNSQGPSKAKPIHLKRKKGLRRQGRVDVQEVVYVKLPAGERS